MTQNTSSAVMQQRSEPHTGLDDFPTPPWATRALCEMFFPFRSSQVQSVREPAANRGHMVKPLREYFGRVEASDIHDYGAGFPVQDYLSGPPPDYTDWTITNPPFKLAEQFIARALECSDNVAIFVRSSFLEGEARYKYLFSKTPPSDTLQFSERVVIHKGKLVNPNKAILDEKTGKMKKPSTATSYSWLIWQKCRNEPTGQGWIAPCRKRLERASDYEGQV